MKKLSELIGPIGEEPEVNKLLHFEAFEIVEIPYIQDTPAREAGEEFYKVPRGSILRHAPAPKINKAELKARLFK